MHPVGSSDPKDDPLTKLIFLDSHFKTLYAGP